ncbi:unnamed protein product, partial [Urochloa humidicola]
PRSGGAGGGGRQRRSQPSASTPPVPEKHLGLGWLLNSKYIPSIVADLQPPETTPDSPENHMNDEEEGMGSDPDVMNEEGEL